MRDGYEQFFQSQGFVMSNLSVCRLRKAFASQCYKLVKRANSLVIHNKRVCTLNLSLITLNLKHRTLYLKLTS